jgi:hypothetical protein
MPDQAGVIHEAEIGRAEFGAQAGLAAAGREEGRGASAAAFNAQKGGRAREMIRQQFVFTFRFLQGELCLAGQESFCHVFLAVGAYYIIFEQR